ncbi:ubiquitin thioesterase OTU1 [Entomortierella parvispora]|uniref:Ubiquitin thioesterase OTU n=1 Tax=Entomortierella parvispora TaxID=205924 RepID=A0A9P3H3E0_9FUNG|nr:ubiquitin thioesterase OTU1 [Entomortierella parvispora]
MRLRIRHKDGMATLTSLTEQSTLLELHNEIAREVKTPAARLELKTGYPPKPLLIDSSSAQSSLQSLGIKDGEQIMTSERPDGSVSSFEFGSTSAASEPTVTSSAPTAQAATATSHAAAFQPPKAVGGLAFGSRPLIPLSGANSAFQAKPVAGAHPFGGLSTVDSSYKPPTPAPAPVSNLTAGPSGSVGSVRVRDQGILVVREVEDDNSCLFNAVAYTLDPSMKSNIAALRHIIAKAIEANPDDYSDAVLGRPRKDYCDWIRRENSWGGAIELAIFSEHYNIEIDSIDVSTNRVDRFGEGKFTQRALLMYSGIHYDAVALTPGLDIPEECDQTQFDIATSEEIINAGIQLSIKLKQAHKYTDVANFTLRCSVCQAGLKGEKDAQQHAQQTMHTSFEEYK